MKGKPHPVNECGDQNLSSQSTQVKVLQTVEQEFVIGTSL